MMAGLEILLMSCVVFGYVSSEGPSNLTFNFLRVISGTYDNRDQVQSGNSGLDFVQIRFIPLDVIALRKLDAVMYAYEEAVNRQIVRLQFRQVFEEAPGLLKADFYNVTEASYYKKPPCNISTEEFTNVKPEDLQLINKCSGEFQVFDKDGFTGALQNCLDTENGAHSHYSCIFECDSFRCFVPEESPEHGTLVPYDFKRKGPKFPVPGLPDKFASFCDKSE